MSKGLNTMNSSVFNQHWFLDDKSLNELEKIKAEKEKLLNSVITKDGEIEFLRQQLNSIQQRAQNITLENTRQREKEAKQDRLEIDNLRKKNEQLKSQLEVQVIDIFIVSLFNLIILL